MSPRHLDRRAFLRLAASLAAAAAAGPSFGKSDFPEKPIRLIVPYGPGGAVDIIGRQLTEVMGRRLGQPFVVENRAGAGSNIGSQAVAKSQPDGYTLLMASPANVINQFLYTNMGFDQRDLAPVGLAAQVPSVLVAAPEGTGNTVAEVVAQAKTTPVSFAHGGSGTSEHLAAEMFRLTAKIDITQVPYKGGAAALPDLMAGRVQYMFTNLIAVLPLIRSKRLKIIAVTDDQRAPAIPDTPTFTQAGFPDVMVSVWYGLLAPAGTPKDIIDTLSEAMLAALKDGALRPKLEQGGARIIAKGPGEFDQFLRSESSRWGTLIRTARITID